jgi:hypothetical protein
MKKPAAKSKSAAKSKPGPAKAATAARDAGKGTPKVARASGAVGYTPAPLKSDGWPPFRYPLQ